MEPIDVTITDYQQMVDLFHAETDRGAAVLAGSYVENFLGIFLKSRMVDASLSERIFSSNGPLSTFSQRIDFAQAFGFLPVPLCRELHLIRKIRNHFAHHPLSASFTASPTREWVASLTVAGEMSLSDGQKFKIQAPKIAFLIAAGVFVAMVNDMMVSNRGEA